MDPEEHTESQSPRAFEHVRRRKHDEVKYKLKDIDSAGRARMISIYGRTLWGGIPGMFIGAFYFGSALLGFLVCWLITAAATYTLVHGSGKFGSTLYNPSGKSTPHKNEFSRARAMAKGQHYAEAVSEYEKAIAIDPTDPVPYVEIARIHRDKLNDPHGAAEWFRRARRDSSGDAGLTFLALRELVELYTTKLGTPEKAIPLLAQIRETRGGTPEAAWAERELADTKRMLFHEDGGDTG